MAELQVDFSKVQVLEEFFNDLATVDQKRIFSASFRKAAKPLIDEAKANSPYDTGNLRRSIGAQYLHNDVAVVIGARKSKGGRHGHLVEYGTEARFRKSKNDAPTGQVLGVHFFEKAYAANEEAIYNTIEQEWWIQIEKFIVRTNKKAQQ